MAFVEIEDSKPGRPPIRIDLSQAEQLCHLGCTLREVAAFCKCSEDTIQRLLKRERDQTWTEFYEIHSATGDISLRREQWKIAHGGGKPGADMLKWLGKNRLGQTDKQQIDLKGDLNVTQTLDYSKFSKETLAEILNATAPPSE